MYIVKVINRIVGINKYAFFQEGEGEEGESVGSDVEGEYHQFKFLIYCFALNCLEKSAIIGGSISYSYQDDAKRKAESYRRQWNLKLEH